MMSNPGLDDKEKERLWNVYREGTPEHDRYVLGKWVPLSGRCLWASTELWKRAPPGAPHLYDMAADVGYSSATHALLVATFADGKPHVIDEWRYKPRTERDRLTSDQQVRAVLTHFGRHPGFRKKLRKSVVDPAAAEWRLVLYNILKRLGMSTIMPTNVKPRRFHLIQNGRVTLRTRGILIDPKCVFLLSELSNAEYDPRWADRGEDRPIKVDDHGIDAFCYYAWEWRMQGLTPQPLVDSS